MNLCIIFLAFGWNNSSGFRGFLSLNTTSACHLEPNAVNSNKIGMTSFPFSVMRQRTIMGDLPFSAHCMYPSFSSSFNRMDNTLGVKPAMESSSLLNRSTPRIPISLNNSIVHFFPSTPKLVLIGH